MPSALNIELPVTYGSAEWLFPPTNRVTVSVTNGPCVATFMLYTDPNAPYNGQSYESIERPMDVTGNYTWSPVDFTPEAKICGIKLRSIVASQLARISFNA